MNGAFSIANSLPEDSDCHNPIPPCWAARKSTIPEWCSNICPSWVPTLVASLPTWALEQNRGCEIMPRVFLKPGQFQNVPNIPAKFYAKLKWDQHQSWGWTSTTFKTTSYCWVCSPSFIAAASPQSPSAPVGVSKVHTAMWSATSVPQGWSPRQDAWRHPR